jgi:hypothetical protein
MMKEHGVDPLSPDLYPPAAKKPKKKRPMTEDGAAKSKQKRPMTEEGAAGMRSMPMDGKCAYHLASKAIFAASHHNVLDIDQWPTQADLAIATVLKNYLDMRGKVEDFFDEIPVIDRSDQLIHWENMMGEGSTAESFVADVADGTKWGGSVELAIAMDATSTGIIIVFADQISEKAADVDMKGAVQPAMLHGLTEGVPKTHNVFAILREGHYYLGFVRTGGVDRGLFEVGDDSNSAKERIIEFLKNSNRSGSRQKRKRGRNKPVQESCLTDDNEPRGKRKKKTA